MQGKIKNSAKNSLGDLKQSCCDIGQDMLWVSEPPN